MSLPCHWCARPARSGPIGLGSVEDDVCVVCRALTGLIDRRLGPLADPEGERVWLRRRGLEAMDGQLTLRYHLGPREPERGCWWCGRPGEPVVLVRYADPGDPPVPGERVDVLFAAPVLCPVCRDLHAAGDAAGLGLDGLRDRFLRALGHEPEVAL